MKIGKNKYGVRMEDRKRQDVCVCGDDLREVWLDMLKRESVYVGNGTVQGEDQKGSCVFAREGRRLDVCGRTG